MNYEQLSVFSATQAAPDSWAVVIADVKSSTVALKSGRYRDVNLVGTACIAAIRNEFSPIQVPYVFGGDGAAFLVSEGTLDRCLAILEGVKRLSESALDLELRVGHLSMREIRDQGHDLSYGFLALGPAELSPYFRGDGIRYAEEVIKSRSLEPPSAAIRGPQEAANIDGLSCRLLPFQATRGRILSVMIEVNCQGTAEDAILSTILGNLKSLGPIERFRPVSKLNEFRPWLSPSWRTEAKLRGIRDGQTTAKVQTVFESLLGTLLFRLNLRNPILGLPSEYTDFMFKQSDWIKMDGTLRLVLDMTANEEMSFLKLLNSLEDEVKLHYGVHASGGSMMTCHFQSAIEQNHAHFIDGMGGGLSAAASMLKDKKVSRAQLKKIRGF